MKKLMIAAVAAMIGIAANASSCTWGVYAMHTDYSGFDDGTYWLVAGADTGFVVYSDGTTNFSSIDSGTIGQYGAAGGKIENLTESNNGDIYTLVVWDGKADGYYGKASAELAGLKDAPPTDATPITFGGGMGLIGSTAVEAVPEPTSGLLLLLGVAGLALKRKRA